MHDGLAVVHGWSSEPRRQRRGLALPIGRTSLQLQCITHPTSLSDQQASALSHHHHYVIFPQTARRPMESSLLNADTGLAEFVFACGVASQLSWQRIMGWIVKYQIYVERTSQPMNWSLFEIYLLLVAYIQCNALRWSYRTRKSRWVRVHQSRVCRLIRRSWPRVEPDGAGVRFDGIMWPQAD